MKNIKKISILLIVFFCILNTSLIVKATNVDIPNVFGDDIRIKGNQENIDINKNFGTKIFDLGDAHKKNNQNNNATNQITKQGEQLNNQIKNNIENKKTKLSIFSQNAITDLEKLKEKYNGKIGLAIILYILKILAFIFIPLTIILLIISFSHDKIFKDDEESIKNSRNKRVVILAIFAVIEILPLLFTIITKGWIN